MWARLHSLSKDSMSKDERGCRLCKSVKAGVSMLSTFDMIVLEGSRFFSLNFIIQQEGQTTPVGPLFCVITVVAIVVQDVWNHHVEYMMMNEYALGAFLLYIFLEGETGFFLV